MVSLLCTQTDSDRHQQTVDNIFGWFTNRKKEVRWGRGRVVCFKGCEGSHDNTSAYTICPLNSSHNQANVQCAFWILATSHQLIGHGQRYSVTCCSFRSGSFKDTYYLYGLCNSLSITSISDKPTLQSLHPLIPTKGLSSLCPLFYCGGTGPAFLH